MTWVRFDSDELMKDGAASLLTPSEFAFHTMLVYRSFDRGHLVDDIRIYVSLWGGRHKSLKKDWPAVKACWSKDKDGALFLDWIDDERESAEAHLKSVAERQKRWRDKKREQDLQKAQSNGLRDANVTDNVTPERRPTYERTNETYERDVRTEPPTPSGDSEDKPRRSRAKPTGPQAECIQHWESEWSRTRLGDVFQIQSKDAIAVARMLKFKGVDAQEVKRRMTNMLESTDPWVAQNASPCLLQSKWAGYGVSVQLNGSARPGASQRVTGDDVVREAARAAGYQW